MCDGGGIVCTLTPLNTSCTVIVRGLLQIHYRANTYAKAELIVVTLQSRNVLLGQALAYHSKSSGTETRTPDHENTHTGEGCCVVATCWPPATLQSQPAKT